MLFVLAGSIWTCVSAGAAAAEGSTPRSESPYIEVSADAVVLSVADRVDFSVSVVSEDVDADRVLSRNNVKLAAVRKAIERAGIAAADMRTGQFQLQPRWSAPPRDPGPSWQPSIVGFVTSAFAQVSRDNGTGDLTYAFSSDELSMPDISPLTYRAAAIAHLPSQFSSSERSVRTFSPPSAPIRP